MDIADWYRGTISSREVLTKIAHLPDTSAFKTAQDWPLQAELLAGVMNEIKAMRSDLYALIAKESFAFKPLLSPASQRAQQAKQAQVRAAHDDVIAQLRGEKRD